MKTIYSHQSFSFLMLIILFFFNSSCEKDEDVNPGNQGTDPPEAPLSLIEVNTMGNAIVDEPKTIAEMTISKDGTVSFEGHIGIEIRGASSQYFPKKSYGVETRDANNQDVDVSLFGFPDEEDWILHAPFSDKSLMRNILIYDLSRDMGMYASRSVFVELSINGNYQGVYLFMEKLKRDKERIAVKKLLADENSGENLTGGYILKIDKVSGGNLGEGYNDLNSFSSNFTPNHANSDQVFNFLYEYPDAEDITTQQKNYISTYITNFEAALASDNFMDPAQGYAAYIDVQSFIDFFLLNEIAQNVDGYRLSTYMHKDMNEKLKMGPVWDFNLAFGNADYCGGGQTYVWAYKINERCPGDYWLIPFWWERLLQDPNFVNQVKTRWNALKGSAFSEASIMAKIANYTEALEKAEVIDKNFNTWDILGTYVWPNNFVGNTYQEENTYLKDWISERLVWLDGAINGL